MGFDPAKALADETREQAASPISSASDGSSPSQIGQHRIWIAREGDGFVALLLVCVAVFAALPFGRLLLAALAPGGHFNPCCELRGATSRVALIAAWNTIETGVLSSIGALVLGAGFALALAVTDIRGKRVARASFCDVAAGCAAGGGTCLSKRWPARHRRS